MKKLILLSITLLIPMSATLDGQMTKKERRFAAKYLESSMEQIFKTIENLSPEQWNYRASEESWSIAGTCEHLLIAEQAQNRLVTQVIINNPNLKIEIPKEQRKTDKEVMTFIEDRSPARKVKTLPNFEPKGTLSSPKEFIAQFKAIRMRNIGFTNTTEAELKSYYYDSPAGKITAYQWLLVMSAHSLRHLDQMKEVMTSTSYPEQ